MSSHSRKTTQARVAWGHREQAKPPTAAPIQRPKGTQWHFWLIHAWPSQTLSDHSPPLERLLSGPPKRSTGDWRNVFSSSNGQTSRDGKWDCEQPAVASRNRNSYKRKRKQTEKPTLVSLARLPVFPQCSTTPTAFQTLGKVIASDNALRKLVIIDKLVIYHSSVVCNQQ